MNRRKGNLKHPKRNGKDSAVFIPKYRKKNIYRWLSTELAPIVGGLSRERVR